MPARTRAVLFAVLALLLPGAAAEAVTPLQPEPKISPGGTAVALSANGDVAVVGDPLIGFPNGIGKNVGAIYVLARKDGVWRSTAALYQQNNQNHSENHFGAAVDVSPDGTVVVAGSPGGDSQSGQRARAEVYDITVDDGGTPHATRVAVLAGDLSGTYFGTSVAVTRTHGTTPHTVVAVGAPKGTPYDEAQSRFRFDAGIVHVFTDPVSDVGPGGMLDVQPGTRVFDLAPGSDGSRLGMSVAIADDAGTIAAGAPWRGPAFRAGAVDVFTASGDTWAGGERLAGKVPGGNLGASVAMDSAGRTVLAGEPMIDPRGVGDAQVFPSATATCTGGVGAVALPATLAPADGGHPGEAFGTSVALSADGLTALVGAPWWDYRGEPTFGEATVPGYAYIEDASFDPLHPTEQVLMPATTPSQGQAGSFFGQSVAMTADARRVLVGAATDANGHGFDYGVGWAFPWSRSAAPDRCAGAAPPADQTPPADTTPPPRDPGPATSDATVAAAATAPVAATDATPAAAAAGSAAAQLAVSCSHRRLALLNVLRRGGRVALLGAADARLVGQKVSIRFDDRTPVATAVVGADGFFSATAPLPPRAVRGGNHARYVAVAGKERSLDLKLTRRVTMERPVARGGKVILSGRVVPPLSTPRSKVRVEQQVACGKKTTVASVLPNANGSFRISVPAPPSARAAIYRLATAVRKTRSNPKRYPSFSLPVAVNLR